MYARDIMKKDVFSVSDDTTVKQLFFLMEKHSVYYFTVVNQYNEPIGVISQKQLLHAIYVPLAEIELSAFFQEALEKRIEELLVKPVKDIMTPEVIGVFPKTPAEVIGQQMFLHHLYEMPVIDQGKIVGVIEPAIVFQALFKQNLSDVPFREPSEGTGAADDAKKIRSGLVILKQKDGASKNQATKRAYPRVDTRVKVVYRLVQGEASMQESAEADMAHTKNLSAGGLLLETNKRVPEGSLLYVKFSLYTGDQPIQPLSRVCWVRANATEGLYDVGISFLALTTEERLRIDRYVSQNRAKM